MMESHVHITVESVKYVDLATQSSFSGLDASSLHVRCADERQPPPVFC